MNKVNAEIFAVGTWNGMKFSAQDLQQIADNFNALLEYHKVPLKFGHNDEQPLTDGQPALGWVTKVWVDGSKLMATFDRVPNIVKKAMDAQLYRKVSVELDLDVEHKGKKYDYVLSGVALLGADIPAVSTLADLDKYLDGDRLAASRRAAFSVSAVDGRNNSPEKSMSVSKEEMQKMISDAIGAAVAPLQQALKAKDDEIALFRKKEDDRSAADKKLKVEAARKGVTEIFEAAVKQGAITPAQRETFKKTLRVEDDDAVLAINLDEVKNLVGGDKVKFAKKSGALEGKEQDDEENQDRVHEDAGEELTRLAREIQDSSKISFDRALARAMEKHPKLAKEWLGDQEAA